MTNTGQLNDSTSAIITDKPQLKLALQELITCHGGKVEELNEPFSASSMANLSWVYIDAQCLAYGRFISFWNQVSTDLTPCPKLIVVAEQPTGLPAEAICLNEPVYRSTFLGIVLNHRQKYQFINEVIADEYSIAGYGSDEVTKILNYHVLIVDDNDINRQIASYTLEPHKAKIKMATNGEEAISILKASQESFDIVLMDCNMPIMNGYDATKAIRRGVAGERYKTIPVIAMTANAMKGEYDKCLDAGMDDYIIKPFDPSALVRKIENIVVNKNDEPTKDNISTEATELESEKVLWHKDDALERLGKREPLLVKILGLYVDGAEQKLVTLENAVLAEDREQVRLSAHALKGISADVGAKVVCDILTKIEAQALEVKVSDLVILIEQLKIYMTETITIFEEYLEFQRANSI